MDLPPPDAGGDGGGEGEGGMEALGNMIKDGWRRTKQTAAVKVQGKGTTETHDPELEASYERVLQVLRQMEGVKNAMESCAAQFGAQFFGAQFWRNSLTPAALRSTRYLRSLVEMLDSVDGLTTKLSDYASEEGAPCCSPRSTPTACGRRWRRGRAARSSTSTRRRCSRRW